MIGHKIFDETIFEDSVGFCSSKRKELLDIAQQMQKHLPKEGVIPQCGTGKTWVGANQPATNRLHLLNSFDVIQLAFGCFEKSVTAIIDKFGFNHTTHFYYMNHSWFSITPPGGYVKRHTHLNLNFLSGVYFIAAPEKSGGFIFERNGKQKQFPVSVDCLYLFRGDLAHSTERNLSSKEKVAIAFDIHLLDPAKDLPPRRVIGEAWSSIENDVLRFAKKM